MLWLSSSDSHTQCLWQQETLDKWKPTRKQPRTAIVFHVWKMDTKSFKVIILQKSSIICFYCVKWKRLHSLNSCCPNMQVAHNKNITHQMFLTEFVSTSEKKSTQFRLNLNDFTYPSQVPWCANKLPTSHKKGRLWWSDLWPPHVPKELLHWLPAGSDKKVMTHGSKVLLKGPFKLNWEGATVVCFDKVKITLTLSVADKRVRPLGMTPGTSNSSSH